MTADKREPIQVLIVDNDTDCLSELLELIAKDSRFVANVVPAVEFSASKVAKADVVLLSGGVWFDESESSSYPYRDEIEFIARDTETPIIGICLGMLLIVRAFGGNTSDLQKRVQGPSSIHLTELGSELLHWPNQVIVEENHSIAVSQLPQVFDILAYSDSGIEIIKHNSLPIMGVQFHPEKSSTLDTHSEWKSLLSSVSSLAIAS